MKESEYFELKGFLSFLILHELKLKAMCGEDLAKRIGQRKGGTLTPGTIYPALKRLRAKKLVQYKRFGRKKMYTLTPEGEKEINNLYKLFSRYFYGLKAHIRRDYIWPKKKAKKTVKKAGSTKKKAPKKRK
ncbi:MAG: PadR family transcriptional regulator [archaeon]